MNMIRRGLIYIYAVPNLIPPTVFFKNKNWFALILKSAQREVSCFKNEYQFSVIVVFHIIKVHWVDYADCPEIFVYIIYTPKQSPFVCILYI